MKSFIASLGEPPERKGGRRHEVLAPVRGRIQEWYRRTGKVREGEVLGKMDPNVPSVLDPNPRPRPNVPIVSPASGDLNVPAQYLYESFLIPEGKVIAYVTEDFDQF